MVITVGPLIGTISLLIILIMNMVRRVKETAIEYSKTLERKKKAVIGVLTPSTAAPASLLITGFISHLKKYAAFDFEIIECDSHGDLNKTSEWTHFLLSQEVDVVYCIGKMVTECVHKIMRSQINKRAIVSGAVSVEDLDQPFSVAQEEIPTTGVVTTYGWHEKISLIKKFLPDCKNVLLLFRSIGEITHIHIKEKKIITTALKKNNINYQTLHVTDIEKSTELNEDVLKGIDLVIISRNSLLMQHAQNISNDATRYGVPVFSTDSSRSMSVFLSSESNLERTIGALCAKKAMKIVEDGANPSSIEVEHVVPVNTVLIINLQHTLFIGFKKNVTRLLSQAKQVTLKIK